MKFVSSINLSTGFYSCFLKSKITKLRKSSFLIRSLFIITCLSLSFSKAYGYQINSEPELINLSSGKAVSASSSIENYGWYMSNLTDNNPNTATNSKGWSSQLGNGANHTEWVSIDLGETKSVNRVDLYARDDCGFIGEGFPVDFTIEVSEDNINWSTVLKRTNHNKPGNVSQKYTFSTINARYVKLVATSLRLLGNDFVMQLAEMSVIGYPVIFQPILSQGKPISASSSVENWGWLKANLTDGNPNTDGTSNGWSSQLGITSNHTEWVSIDLGATNNITQVNLYPRNNSNFVGEGFPIDFTIQVSEDNSNWMTVVNETGHFKPGNMAQKYTIPSVDARYVRLVATNLRQLGNDFVLQLAEMSILGSPIILPITLSSDKTVSASSSVENWGWFKGNLTDSNPNTDGTSNGWSSELGITSNHTEWVSIDLGEIQNVTQVDLYPRNDSGNVGEGFPIDFKIQLSLDNISWSTVITTANHAKPTNAPQIFTFPEMQSRYVRIDATNLRQLGNDFVMQFAEISVIGTSGNFTLSTTLSNEKFVSASSSVEDYGWYKGNLNDGNSNSDGNRKGWSSELGITTNHTEWVGIDLGTTNNITQVNLYPRDDCGLVGDGFPVDFTIQVSTDNSNWSTVVTESNYMKPDSSPQIFILSEINARYVKLVATNLRQIDNDYVMQLAEMSVIGTMLPAPPNIINLSTYKSVTASTSEESNGWFKANLTDSIFVTNSSTIKGWSSQFGITSNHTEWVSIDLGLLQNVSRVDLYPRNDSGFVGDGFPIDFTIQVSEDNVIWSTMVIESNYSQPDDTPQVFTFAPINARYVKLVATNLRQIGNDYLLQLAEMAVFGLNLYNPESNLVIVLSPTADEVDRFAATELQSYLSKITGSLKPEVNYGTLSSGKTNIVIGASNESLPASILSSLGTTITETSLGLDGYKIKKTTYSGEDVVLLTGYKTRAALFAAYQFLEQIGCRFMGQKSLSFEEVVPYNPNLTIPALDLTKIPDTKYRMLNNNDFFAKDSDQLEKVCDWGAKNGYNSMQLGLRSFDEFYDASILLKRGIEINLGTHNWEQFIHLEPYDYTWYTDEAYVTTFLDSVKIYALNHPEVHAIGAWQPDGDQQAIRETGKDNITTWRFAEWNLYITNRVAEMFENNNIDQRVMWMVYSRGNVVPIIDTIYLKPHNKLDLYYFNQNQDYAIKLENEVNLVSWMTNDTQRRLENSDYVSAPVPDSVLLAKQKAIDWNTYCNSVNFSGKRVFVDHLNFQIGRWLGYPPLSYTQLGPWEHAESDLTYIKTLNYDGWTNAFEWPYINYLNREHSPSPYWFRRSAEAMWNNAANRAILDVDFYENYYGSWPINGVKYATRIKDYFDIVYNDIVHEPASSATSVSKVQGEYFTTITNIYNDMNNNPNVTQEQKNRIFEVYLWHKNKYIPRKVEYKDKGDLFNYSEEP